MTNKEELFSIVIPFYNEEGNIDPLFDELMPALNAMGEKFIVICVDDGSADATYAQLLKAQQKYYGVKILKLSRNFGKEAALTAGLDYAPGDAVIIMDGDLQHPPETIPEFIKAFRKGIDVSYGVRRSRDTDGPARATFSTMFYRLFSAVGEVAIPANAGDFRLMSRRAVDALKTLPERRRFMKGLYSWIGFNQQPVYYNVKKRRSGDSKWPFRTLVRYAWNGLISFSTMPLRFSTYIGTFVALVSSAYGIWIIFETLIYGRSTPGYATIAAAVFFLGGVQLLSIGVLGEYIARIFDESKKRPTYIIEDIHENS